MQTHAGLASSLLLPLPQHARPARLPVRAARLIPAYDQTQTGSSQARRASLHRRAAEWCREELAPRCVGDVESEQVLREIEIAHTNAGAATARSTGRRS